MHVHPSAADFGKDDWCLCAVLYIFAELVKLVNVGYSWLQLVKVGYSWLSWLNVIVGYVG
jgi:hypothetical protein